MNICGKEIQDDEIVSYHSLITKYNGLSDFNKKKLIEQAHTPIIY